jgi:hypothetical protein
MKPSVILRIVENEESVEELVDMPDTDERWDLIYMICKTVYYYLRVVVSVL